MKNVAKIIALSVLILLTSCDKSPQGYNYNSGSLPETPVNLTDFNTEFDDYNSTAPTLGKFIPFCFSTNRNSDGGDFDIVYLPMFVDFNKTTGILKVTNEYPSWGLFGEEYWSIQKGLNKIKTIGNEFGPNLVIDPGSNGINLTLLFSTDITGNSQINYISDKKEEDFSEPREVDFLNSDFEDMYPTINADRTKIYFCSNRGGESFNFYYVNVNSELDTDSILSDTSSFEVFINSTLSSNSDDKCPSIFGDKMVFASNREGGFGGFDLYYSILENGEWSEAINFGEKINTEFDEYRPILFDERVSETQTMMVFSSNRTGGKGGFDLYFVGIDNE